MAYKNVINNSGKDLTVSMLTRKGAEPMNPGDTISQNIKSNDNYRFTYGDDANPFLDGVTIAWQNGGSNASQAENVTTRGSEWDNTLNTNNTLTISSADDPRISGANS